MMYHSLLARVARDFHRPRHPVTARPRVEALEDRACPAITATWTGAVNSDWSNNGNWQGGQAPLGAGDTAVLTGKLPNPPGGNITHDPIVDQVVTIGRVDALADFAGHTLTVNNNLEVDGDANQNAGLWKGGTLTIADQKLFSVQGGAYKFTDGSITTTSTSVLTAVMIGQGGKLTLDASFSSTAVAINVGYKTNWTNDGKGTLEIGSNLAAPVSLTNNAFVVVKGSSALLNIDIPSVNWDSGLKAAANNSGKVLLGAGGKEVVGAGPASNPPDWTPKPLWSAPVTTYPGDYGNLDCEYTSAAMKFQDRGGTYSIQLGDDNSVSNSSYTQAPGSTVSCSGTFSIETGTADFPSPSQGNTNTILNATSATFSAAVTVTVGTAGAAQWVNLSIGCDTTFDAARLYVSTGYDLNTGPVGDTLAVAGTLTFTNAAFTINGVSQWFDHGPWEFATATTVAGTVPTTATAAGNWTPTWAISGVGTTGIQATW